MNEYFHNTLIFLVLWQFHSSSRNRPDHPALWRLTDYSTGRKLTDNNFLIWLTVKKLCRKTDKNGLVPASRMFSCFSVIVNFIF